MVSRSDFFTYELTAMRNVILLSTLLLACCQQQVKETPELWKKHCAAAAQVKMDRQMNTAYRQGFGGYNAAQVKQKYEKECLKRIQREQNSPSSKSGY